MAAAGYIDEPVAKSDSGTITSGIKDTEDLSQEEIDKFNKYVTFLKTSAKLKKNEVTPSKRGHLVFLYAHRETYQLNRRKSILSLIHDSIIKLQ